MGDIEIIKTFDLLNTSDKLQTIDKLLEPLNNLEELDLSFNNIAHFSEEADLSLERLKYVTLSNNNLSFLGSSVLRNCPKLMVLNLTSNKFQIYKGSDFQFSSSVRLDLSKNNITTVDILTQDSSFVKEHIKITSVILRDNQLHCNTSLDPFLWYISDHNQLSYIGMNLLVFLESESLTCAGPPELHNLRLVDVLTREERCVLSNNSCLANCRFYVGNKESNLSIRLHCDAKSSNAKNLTINCSTLGNVLKGRNIPFSKIFMNISNTRLSTFTYDEYIDKLKVIDMSYNDLRNLNSRTLGQLNKLDEVYLHNNPWDCRCDLIKLVNKLSSINNNTSCGGNRIDLNLEEKLCGSKIGFWGWIAAVVIIILSLVIICQSLMTPILVFIYRHANESVRRLLPHPDKMNKTKRFDAYISFADEDAGFVTQCLYPRLSSRFTINFHFWDDQGGQSMWRVIQHAIRDSKRVIVVASQNYFSSDKCRFEEKFIMQETKKNPFLKLIYIVYNELDGEISSQLKNDSLLYEDSLDFWKRLENEMPRYLEGLLSCYMKMMQPIPKETNQDEAPSNLHGTPSSYNIS